MAAAPPRSAVGHLLRLLPALVLLALAGRGGAAQTAGAQTAPPPERAGGVAAEVVVGSKVFTESVVLGEIATDLARDAGADATHRREIGGTRVVWGALLRGDVDAYPEYTGTLAQEIFADEDVSTPEALRAALAREGVRATPPLGFNNTYAVGMTESRAEALGVETLSDLRAHPALRFGFSNEFLDREDGWPGLRRAYGLPQADVRGLDHDLAYRALAAGDLDAVDLYSTDAEVPYYGLRVLEDDRGFFPRYDAVLLYRADLAERAPAVVAAWGRLAGALTADSVAALNARVKIDGETEAAVAAAFVRARFGVDAQVETVGRAGRVWQRTKEHLALVGLSLAAAIVVAIPLGIAAAKVPWLEAPVLGVVSVAYTIPSLALLVFMLPVLGIGAPPALAALFLYSLLPIVRNTHAGLVGIAPELRESAAALGLPARVRLRRVELPLAAPSVLAGVQTSAVINVGTATLGALVGAGGYGQPILTGIRLDDVGLILEGAVPAAVLALAVQGLFSLAGRVAIPRGLRL
ncbi:glycine betaine ABC transporter substrate-binding protein [Rubrivirga sp. S365]|uniref:ABC transporter permease/substrate-binding protein n=1 Tax=Rubrivirga sp. S365 TaxID=3076080 RepID=UPI0028C7AD5F|nr:glycine betaine ABC transporter substrate-binding protein [Rubrivirga sp. S365]MDT7857812.1 glycine betaine ABC transporter substrate-binding protein [Rubrivirga sp. S365]